MHSAIDKAWLKGVPGCRVIGFILRRYDGSLFPLVRERKSDEVGEGICICQRVSRNTAEQVRLLWNLGGRRTGGRHG